MTMINTQKPPERKQVMIQQKRKWYQHPFVNANIIGAAALAAFLLVAKNCGERPQPQKTQSQTCEVCEKGYRTERLTLPNGYVIKCLKPEPEPPKAQPKDGKKVQAKVTRVAPNMREPMCGDGKCEEPESIETCLKDCGYPCAEKRVAKKPDCNPMTNLTGCGPDSVCNKETCMCEKKEEPSKECNVPKDQTKDPRDVPRYYRAAEAAIENLASQYEEGKKVGARVHYCMNGEIKVELLGDFPDKIKNAVKAAIAARVTAIAPKGYDLRFEVPLGIYKK